MSSFLSFKRFYFYSVKKIVPVVGVSIPPLATPPAPITKEKLKEVAKETAKPAAIQEAVGGASNASPSHTLSPGRKGALEKGNVTRAYFGEDASMMACLFILMLCSFLHSLATLSAPSSHV